MLFATDAAENRVQRARMGEFLRACGVVEAGDWVLSTHVSGHFYRYESLLALLIPWVRMVAKW